MGVNLAEWAGAPGMAPSRANTGEKLLKVNERSAEYGLLLTQREAERVAEAEREAAGETGRVIFGESAAVKLAEKFMRSSYISQYDYADTLEQLVSAFYESKEETGGIFSDDELIDIMFGFFEGRSGGDIDTLMERDMESVFRRIRGAQEI